MDDKYKLQIHCLLLLQLFFSWNYHNISMDKKWWICHALSNAPAKCTSWWQFLDPDQIWCLISCLPTDGVDSMFMNHKVTSWVAKWVTHSVSCSLRGSPTQVIARLVSALAGTLACVYKEHTTSVTHFLF